MITLIYYYFQCKFFIIAGAKHILDALHKDANEAFNSSRQIDKVITRIVELREAGTPNGSLDVGAALMTPVQPMLAMACKSVDMAFEKCPNGWYTIFSEKKSVFKYIMALFFPYRYVFGD